MSKRRGHGEGTISRRKDGRWEARYQVAVDGHGKRVRKIVYGRTRRDALNKLDELRGELRQSGRVTSPGKIKVAGLLDGWLATGRSRWKHSTRRDAEQVVRLHIKPRIGGIRLADLTSLHVEQLLHELEGEGKSARVRLKVYRALYGAVRRGVRQKLLPRNVVEDVDVPKYQAPERATLDEQEAKRLLKVLHEEPLYPAFLLAMVCGVRASEIWGLTWADIDLTAGEVRVRRTLNERLLKGSLIEGGSVADAFEKPKTDKSLRRIALPKLVMDALRRHRKQQRVASVANLVFTDERGEPIRHSRFYKGYRRLLRRAGLKSISFHDQRHTAATLMLAAGVDLKVVSQTLGHSTAAFTANVYGHVLDSMRRDAADRMDRLLG